LIILTLLGNSTFSQNLLIIDGDTLAVMPIDLVKKANIKLLKCDSIASDLYFSQQINLEMCGQISNYKLNEIDYSNSIAVLRGIIATQDTLRQKEVQQLESDVAKYKKRFRLVGIGSSIIVILLLLT
jgi:hypothetical protein